MKKYHTELKHLAEVIKENKGYICGECESCKIIYKEFLKIVKKIRSIK